MHEHRDDNVRLGDCSSELPTRSRPCLLMPKRLRYRVLPQPPDYRSHAPTSGQHQHLLQRYFFLLRVVYFSKVENSDGSSSRLPDSQRPSERVHTSEGGTNQRVVLSFVKAGSTLHFEDGALVRGSRSNAASRSADVRSVPFSSAIFCSYFPSCSHRNGCCVRSGV